MKFFISSFLLFLISAVYSLEFNSNQELIDYILEQNTQLQLEEQYVIEHNKSAKLNLKDFFPSLTFDLYEYDKVSTGQSNNRTKVLSLGLKQKITDGGKRLLTYNMNKTNSQYLQLDYQQNRINFIIQTLNTVYSYLLINNMIEIEKKLIEQNDLICLITEKKYQTGLCVKTDYLEALISKQQLIQEYNQLIAQQKQLKLEIQFLLKNNDDFVLNYDLNHEQKENIDFTDENSDIAVKIYNNNIELKKLETKIYYLEQQYKLVGRFFIPDINLEGGMTFSGQSYPLTQPEYYLKLTVYFDKVPFTKINWNNAYNFKYKKLESLTNSYSQNFEADINYFSNRKLEKTSLLQAKEEYLSLKENIRNSIISYINEHQNLLSTMKICNASIDLLKEKFEISKVQYEQGLITLNDLLNNENKLFNMHKEYLQTKINYCLLIKKIKLFSQIEINQIIRS